MRYLDSVDAAWCIRAAQSPYATEHEAAFLGFMAGLAAAHEPVSDEEYARVQRLTGGYVSVAGSIFTRATNASGA